MGAEFSQQKNKKQKLPEEVQNEKKHKFGGYKSSDKPRPGYYITPSEIYYRGEPILEAIPSSFTKLGNSWAKDKENVYFQGNVVYEADPKTFRVENKFGKDKNNRYYRGKVVK